MDKRVARELAARLPEDDRELDELFEYAVSGRLHVCFYALAMATVGIRMTTTMGLSTNCTASPKRQKRIQTRRRFATE